MRSGIILLIYVTLGFATLSGQEKDKDDYSRNQVSMMDSDKPVIAQYIKVDTFSLKIIPPSSGVQYYKDGIIFLSSSKTEGQMLPQHLSFGVINTHYAILQYSVLENPVLFSPFFTFSYPCDATTFSSDYNTMYFAKYSRSDGGEKIFHARLSQEINNQGNWIVNQDPLDFCTGNSTYTHPSLSEDGRIMIFSSNRSGSAGGMDLFITRKTSETWSSPENLGSSINTKSNELFPYLDIKNNLYFSSDGLDGRGGFDIFICKFNDGSWGNPVNLSSPINTEFDDIAFKVNRKDGKSAFYTIRQKSDQPDQLLLITLASDNTRKYLSDLSQLFLTNGLDDKDISAVMTQEVNVSVKSPPVNIDSISAGVKKVPEGKEQPARVSDDGKQAIKETTQEIKQEIKPKEITGSEQQSNIKPVATIEAEPPVENISQAKIESITEKAKIAEIELSESKDKVVYRVQILASVRPKGSYKITVNNKTYNSYEYLFSKAYRTCIGEFSSLEAAIELQDMCRKSGLPQAFVVAFKNNVRSTDPALFR